MSEVRVLSAHWGFGKSFHLSEGFLCVFGKVVEIMADSLKAPVNDTLSWGEHEGMSF